MSSSCSCFMFFKYASLSPNIIRMQCFCAVKTDLSLLIEMPPHTVIPCDNFQTACKEAGKYSLIQISCPVQHLSFLARVVR